MNLYEMMGLLAVAGSGGAIYGATQQHDLTFWASLLIGVLVGVGVFVFGHRLVGKASERALPAHYIGMPICIVVTTVGVSWLVRTSL